MVRTFHIKKNRVNESEKSYSFQKFIKRKFFIPKSQIIYVQHYKVSQNKGGKWVAISVTEWAWNKIDLAKLLEPLQENEEAYVAGESHYDVDWDYVIAKRRIKNKCFYCMKVFLKGVPNRSKTRDHLIPRAMLKAYGKPRGIPNNVVPCCRRCNKDKANLHPEVYKKFIMGKLHETGGVYYRVVLDTLNRLIVKK